MLVDEQIDHVQQYLADIAKIKWVKDENRWNGPNLAALPYIVFQRRSWVVNN